MYWGVSYTGSVVKKVLIFVGILVVGLIGVGFMLPSEIGVERSKVIRAPPDVIYESVGTLETWSEWTAWSPDKDPTMKYTREGPPSGPGAIQRWTSDQSGNGSITVTKANPKTGIYYDLDIDGMKSTGAILLQRAPSGDGTKVGWSMVGDVGNNVLMRYMGPMFDAWVGKDFDEGLANLKVRAEKAYAARPSPAPASLPAAAPTGTSTATQPANPASQPSQ